MRRREREGEARRGLHLQQKYSFRSEGHIPTNHRDVRHHLEVGSEMKRAVRERQRQDRDREREREGGGKRLSSLENNIDSFVHVGHSLTRDDDIGKVRMRDGVT
jgi:hypothetical protein